MEQDYNIKHWTEPCHKVDCRKSSCKCGIEKVFIPTALGDDSKGSPAAPANGAYCNALVAYEANGHMYIYSKDGIPTRLSSGGGGDYDEIIEKIQDDLSETERNLSQETINRVAADDSMQLEINAKQNTLVSGTNIKTINNQSVLGSGNITIEGGAGGGLSDDIKNAILDCFENVAWTSASGQQYYEALEELFFPPKPLQSISAVFNQGSAVVYPTDSLDSLKQYLTVTATYTDSSTETLDDSDYTLSGTLTEGTSTITATYEGKTATFNVTVTAVAVVTGIEATYTQGTKVVYDDATLDSLKTDLVVKAVFSDSTKVPLEAAAYTLSGTLTPGTSTITVTYETFTTTFTVVVTEKAELSSISAVFTQTGTIYTNTPLDNLKQSLVVTATYSDSTTQTIPASDYTLSGTLTEGTSTITVTYETKTTTFNVTVTAAPTLSSIEATFTQGTAEISDTDTLDSLKQYLVVVATYSDSSTVTLQDSDYTLSGTLAVGTSTITVTYEGLTDTFDVIVTHAEEVKAIETLASTTDSNSIANYTFFIYNSTNPDKFEFNHAKKITAIEADINTAGTITLYALPKSKIATGYNYTTDANYTLLGEVTASTTGVQKLTLDTPITLPEGYAIGFRGGATWRYTRNSAPTDTQGFCGGTTTLSLWNTRALGINVYIEG